MFSAYRIVELDCGHRVPFHKSKCRNPHGHRYKVEVQVDAHSLIDIEGASDEGMVLDFGDLKTIMMQKVHDVLDHGFIVYEDDYELLSCFGLWGTDKETEDRPIRNATGFANGWKIIIFPYIPTAENIAQWIWEQIEPEIKASNDNPNNPRVWLTRVAVHETPNSTATYVPEGK